ncbi:hypothetical protein [Kineococcus sp. SYSU DK005]|uniref:hypothetical protein n=1 Tax=Kineococcus sp. SYSU DK005 TaxID=3383126 RepID=UPI003D7CAFD9
MTVHHRTTAPRPAGAHRRERSRRGRRARLGTRRTAALLTALVLPVAGAGTVWAATGVTATNPDKLVARGAVDTTTGFPAWYQDSKGTRLELCLDATNPFCGFLPGDVPDPEAPVVFPENFPEEAFYFLAGSSLNLPGGGTLTYTTGLEAAFANAVQTGDQLVFGRVRLVLKGGPRSTTVTVKHPYGEAQIDTDATGAGRIVEDITAAPGQFDLALKSNVGPFLVDADGPVTGPDGAKYVGNPDVATTVTGGLNGTRISVTWPGQTDAAAAAAQTDLFTVQGRISTNTGVRADAAVVDADGYLDVFATSAGSALEVVGQGGFPTTGMVDDPGSQRFYARIPFTGTRPTSVQVRNISDKPASTSTVDVVVRDVTVSRAEYDGSVLTVAATAKGGGELTVAGLGTLTSGTTATFPVLAPPAVVTVTRGGSSATAPVVVTGGELTRPLPPTPAGPTDPDPGGETSTSTGGTVTPDPGTPPAVQGPVAKVASATASVVRGASTALDASASTGAVSYSWKQVGGPAATLNGGTTAKPTVTLPLAVKANAAAPAAIDNAPAVFEVTVTGAQGTEPSTATVSVVPDVDAVAVTGARHRAGTELRLDGTALFGGAARTLSPATQVNLYDTSGATPRFLATVNVDTLGAWTYRVKPGPTTQITSVLAQSSRGGSATSAVTPR